MSLVVTLEATKMRKLKSTLFTICLVLSITQFSLGDDVLEMIRVIEERFNAFEESEHQKDERIAALESELQSLRVSSRIRTSKSSPETCTRAGFL